MAKRFNVSIPDALAERMEPFKNDLSLSALMQDAIERELTRLTMSDADKELRDQFKAAAINAWIERFPGLGAALAAYADHLFDLAAKDGQSDIFRFYRALFFSAKGEEAIKEVFRQRYPSYPEAIQEVDSEGFIDHMNAIYRDHFIVDFQDFACDKARHNMKLLDDSLVDQVMLSDGSKAYSFTNDFWEFLEDNLNIRELAFNALDARVRKAMSEGDVYQYVLDVDIELVNSYRGN